MDDDSSALHIRGARERNLKNISVRLPLGSISVVTGVSGCGKSTLVEQTLFAESRRRYLAAADVWSGRATRGLPRPAVDEIRHLPPMIGVFPPHRRPGPHETVGSLAEFEDGLRAVYAMAAELRCPDCGLSVSRLELDDVVAEVMALPLRAKLLILAPIHPVANETTKDLIQRMHRAGYVRARIDGEIVELGDSDLTIGEQVNSVELVVDRLIIKPEIESRLRESLMTAWELGDGWAIFSEDSSGTWRDRPASRDPACPGCSRLFPQLVPGHFDHRLGIGACPECQGTGRVNSSEEDGPTCPDCDGSRLGEPGRIAFLKGRTFAGLLAQPLIEARREVEVWLDLPNLPAGLREYLLPEITRRLAVLEELGLGYLAGDRAAATLSQGEWQRVRLGACLSLELTDGCYVLDEPTNGLHACDVGSVLRVLERLRQQGNTVVVVDHDLQAITAADWQIDLGPGAGQLGGEVLFEGPPERLASDSSLSSPTARGLKTCDRPPIENRLASSPQDGSPIDGPWLEFAVPRVRNLQEGTVRIPLGRLTCLVGVSGSGKSTLLNEVLAPGIQGLVNPRAPATSSTVILSRLRTLSAERGRSSRSCVATLLGIWDGVRRLYARTKEAKLRGFGPRRFSYLSAEGWCPRCQGRGTVSLAETTVEGDCPACGGRRFGPQTLTVTYRGLSIGDCLLQTVSELAEFFGSFEKLSLPLRELEAIGLGYLPLGQPTAHLSSGERQRIGLARELSQRDSRPAAFLLDEPTTGLHVADVEQLTASLRRIVEAGHTVIAADHHLTLVASSDWLIEVGPGGGTSGGRLIAQGDPTEVAKLSTPTGFALRTSPKEMASRG